MNTSTRSNNESLPIVTHPKDEWVLQLFIPPVPSLPRSFLDWTCAEVADELVVEMAQDQGVSSKGGSIDDKNIRRRVYDALNVLLAIDVVDKDKKNVR
jgi:hypothetical protein